MKWEFFTYSSDLVIGDTINRLPILDWEFYYDSKSYVFKHRAFTGEYYSVLYWGITLLRRKFTLRVEFNHGIISPEEALKQYHARIKNVKI